MQFVVCLQHVKLFSQYIRVSIFGRSKPCTTTQQNKTEEECKKIFP